MNVFCKSWMGYGSKLKKSYHDTANEWTYCRERSRRLWCRRHLGGCWERGWPSIRGALPSERPPGERLFLSYWGVLFWEVYVPFLIKCPISWDVYVLFPYGVPFFLERCSCSLLIECPYFMRGERALFLWSALISWEVYVPFPFGVPLFRGCPFLKHAENLLHRQLSTSSCLRGPEFLSTADEAVQDIPRCHFIQEISDSLSKRNNPLK